jgi:hypothetical protein
MAAFAILTNRKRAIIALVHTVAFLGLAVRDFAVASRLSGVLGGAAAIRRSMAFGFVYLAVTIVLGYLLKVSKSSVEQLYFALCTGSASTGVLRALVGDASFPQGQYLRMGLLACAVITGSLILRLHAEQTMPAGSLAGLKARREA